MWNLKYFRVNIKPAPTDSHGHVVLLQGWVSVSSPEQFWPPNTGEGCVQLRVRVITPESHVTLQRDQSDHPLQLPFTARNSHYRIIRLCWPLKVFIFNMFTIIFFKIIVFFIVTFLIVWCVSNVCLFNDSKFLKFILLHCFSAFSCMWNVANFGLLQKQSLVPMWILKHSRGIIVDHLLRTWTALLGTGLNLEGVPGTEEAGVRGRWVVAVSDTCLYASPTG